MYMYIQLTSSAGQGKANNADTNQMCVHISAEKHLHQIRCIRIRQEKKTILLFTLTASLCGVLL